MRGLVIIPCYNEENTIASIVQGLKERNYDYIVINDASSDNSLKILRKIKANFITNTINVGLTETFRLGLNYAKENNYDYVIQIDGDGQHRIDQIPKLEYLAKENDIVIGSRFKEQENKSHDNFLKKISTAWLKFLIKKSTKLNITDPTSGMRLYKKSMYYNMIKDHNITPEPNVIVLAARNGMKVSEIQVKMEERQFGESYLNKFNALKYMVNETLAILFLLRKKIQVEENDVN